MAGRCILILGGARSGKSRFAQDMAARLDDAVLFVATAEALDDEMRRRIAVHQRERPSSWRTLEAPSDLGHRIVSEIGDSRVVIVDCLTLFVSNLVMRHASGPNFETVDEHAATRDVTREIATLVECLDQVPATFILVSNEVGLGLVPEYPLGRVYRDCLGRVNQQLAARADEVWFTIAGLPMKIKG